MNEEQAKAFENKEVTIKNLREKVEDMDKQIDSKKQDIENNNSQLSDLKAQLSKLISECENLYNVYDEKRMKVLEMKSGNRNVDYSTAWKDSGGWGDDGSRDANEWSTENWAANTTSTHASVSAVMSLGNTVKYRALYEFVARNNDEISFQPGDIINVPVEQTGEPGWLAGEIRGHTGWFPESYVEPVDGVGVRGMITKTTTIESAAAEDVVSKPLEGIQEVPETVHENVEAAQNEVTSISSSAPETIGEVEYYIANYPYQSQEQGDLSFNAGETIIVLKKEGDWWTGKIGENIGIFPSNYVQKVEVVSCIYLFLLFVHCCYFRQYV